MDEERNADTLLNIIDIQWILPKKKERRMNGEIIYWLIVGDIKKGTE